MKAADLKVGSVIEIKVPFSPDKTEQVQVKVERCSDTYVWFPYTGYQRIGRTTIDKYPTLFKIISI